MHPNIISYLTLYPRREWEEALERTLIFGIEELRNQVGIEDLSIYTLRDLTAHYFRELKEEEEELEAYMERDEVKEGASRQEIGADNKERESAKVKKSFLFQF
jgi:hypothetical protein